MSMLFPQLLLSLLATSLFHNGYVISTDGRKMFISLLGLVGFDHAITRRFWRGNSLLFFVYNINGNNSFTSSSKTNLQPKETN